MSDLKGNAIYFVMIVLFGMMVVGAGIRWLCVKGFEKLGFKVKDDKPE